MYTNHIVVTQMTLEKTYYIFGKKENLKYLYAIQKDQELASRKTLHGSFM